MFGNGWLTHIISTWTLEISAKCTIMHELVLVRPYMLSNKMLPTNHKNLVFPKNSLVLMWRCSMTLLSKIKSELMMNLFFSKKQSMKGKRDIQRWLLTHTNRKQRQDFLDTAWLIEDAEMNASRARKGCMEVLREALSSERNVHPKTHAPRAKRWLFATLDVLSKNNIDRISLARQVVNTLTKRRGKVQTFDRRTGKLCQIIHAHATEHHV